MAYFYHQGRLKLGDPQTPSAAVDIENLAARHSGPVYIYDFDNIENRYRAMEEAMLGLRHSLHFAMKSNSHAGILRGLARLGAGADTVSAGEIKKALEAGIPASKIIFSGVGKTVAEIEVALRAGIKQINVESPQELERIALVAQRLDCKADVAFRMNPDVNPKTHPYITTGFRENKFGMDESFLPSLKEILARHPKHLRLRGLTMHIGSLLFDLQVIREAILKTMAIHRTLLAEGHALDRLDIGGGIGIHYDRADESAELQLVKEYGMMARETLKGLDVEVLTEPGRILVARSGVLVSEVQYVKKAPAKTFAILDTGMHHIIRPALYGAKHRILALVEKSGRAQSYDIVGPICESSDFLGKDIELNDVQPGDRLAIADVGAYGFVMASTYNSHRLPDEVLISRQTIVE